MRRALRPAVPLAALLLTLTACTPGGRTGAGTGSGGGDVSAQGPRHTTRWQPRPGTPWQWQLDGRVDPSVDVPVYDIDGFENTAADVARLHRAGRRVICYVNAGAWEDFRPDKGAYPKRVLGRTNGWAGERWLDIRRLDVLGPILARRFDMCRAKGFDAVEPDLLDGYANRTGFPLTARHQLAFNRMVARLAHARGLSVGLKNDVDQVPALVRDFDFAVNEECAQYHECAALTPFVKARKAVFHVEYALPNSRFCAEAKRLGLSSMRKKLKLGVWRRPC
ncbi:endo alpha-1,4 polygalactosaminidase [Streptomyces sp. VRA16 Mangrove soil]|uniref:endo alpha-1,4 polygalactosaminidase n=1 Tax=Streptomyces sp. VRA16 Mangrove soil TaxID=2817434 RepID=UPI001A9F911D|nr:endo alpha-1,4 polygalactosaminidase [Streptomyces sp. VRA16 Mangrove soil]MBO1335572.1 endo alpha-1,4 polygalactosaminidase [Streptomyces sp. VRA16 Mangrove soil]